MRLQLKANSSRSWGEISNLQQKLTESVFEYDRYTFQGWIELTDPDAYERVAVVQGTFFDEMKILNDGESITNIADWDNGEVYEAIAQLADSGLLEEECDPDKDYLPLFTCYIERLYVSPKYRNKKIGRYILSNLNDIFQYFFHITIHCFVTYPKPLTPDREEVWYAEPDEDGSLKKRMIDVIEKAGYRELNGSGFYALNEAAIR